MNKLTRQLISQCPNELALVELHQKHNVGASRGTSIAWANHILNGRMKKDIKKIKDSLEPKPTIRYFNDTDGD